MPGERMCQLGRPYRARVVCDAEWAVGIRQSRSPMEHGRESDGAIVPLTLETT
jgi:hypothetical protein